MKTESQAKNKIKGKRDPYFSTNKEVNVAAPFGKRCLGQINECILNHRYEEAAKLLWIMCQDRTCFDLVLYKGLMVVLENLVSDIEAVSNVKRLYLTNKLEIKLEYLLYALKNDVHGEEESFYVEGKNTKKYFVRKTPQLDHLYSAYCALINYIAWAKVCQSQESQVDRNVAFSAIATFKNLVNSPGIWDIFVLKLIEMLEYYEEFDEIEEVLKKYVEHNPEHINAYIYLCVHLHKHNCDQNTFIHYAKILADLCPSDDRVLLLVKKLEEIGKNLKKSLILMFNFLDYPVNGNKVLAWQLLSSLLQKAKTSKKSSSMKAVRSSWNLRQNIWSIMYFKTSSKYTETIELILCKIKVISVLEPGHEYISYIQEKFPYINKELQMLSGSSSPLGSEDFRTFYEINDDIRSRE